MGEVPFEFPKIRELLQMLDVHLSRHKAQHFLRKHEICTEIARLAGLTPAHRVVEIGTGLGNLTVELAKMAGSVVTVEKDKAFCEWHDKLGAVFPNIQFVYSDFLKVELESLIAGHTGPVSAAGNLPYQITAPILFRLIESAIPWESITIMVQREVAERLVAAVPDRHASALTYKVSMLYTSTIEMDIPPAEFLPPPRVDSSVVVLKPRATPLIRDIAHRQRVFKLVTGIFTHRRRTLGNAMHLGGVTVDRAAAEIALRSADIDPIRRPETLSLDDVLRLEAALG